MTPEPDDLERLVARILASGKYRALNPAVVRAIGARELAARGSLKAAIRATRGRLHQIAGAFLERTPPYAAWLAALGEAAGDRERLRAICLEALRQHASTRERLPDLEQFYPAIFAALPPISSVMDLACGLNPLAAPWMPLAPGTRYLACDVYTDLNAFLATALPLLGLSGVSSVCDLSNAAPPWRADVALLLKTLPLLEHMRRGAGPELLRRIDALYLVVSFPTRSLGGRNVGMAATYGAQMRAIAASAGWPLRQLEFASEIVFVVRKGGAE
ncbi:MAG: 16S rRNA methyltransferase [Chloroflexaceae bacterium]